MCVRLALANRYQKQTTIPVESRRREPDVVLVSRETLEHAGGKSAAVEVIQNCEWREGCQTVPAVEKSVGQSLNRVRLPRPRQHVYVVAVEDTGDDPPETVLALSLNRS